MGKHRRVIAADQKKAAIARDIVAGKLTLKQIASNHNVSYATAYSVLKERVNVHQVLTFRYPEDATSSLDHIPRSPTPPDKK